MFDLSKWENSHPAVKRFAQQAADVLESLAEHLIDQAQHAVESALDLQDTAASVDALSGPQTVPGVPDDQPAAPEPQAPAQPAADPVPPELAAMLDRWAAAAGWTRPASDPTPPGPPERTGSQPSPIGDSGPAGVVAGAGQDVPVTGEPAAQLIPGGDIPVTHNVDPADVVGADSHNASSQQ